MFTEQCPTDHVPITQFWKGSQDATKWSRIHDPDPKKPVQCLCAKDPDNGETKCASEVSLVRAANGNIVGGCRIDNSNYNSDVECNDNYDGLAVSISTDEGYTWSNGTPSSGDQTPALNPLFWHGRHHASLVHLSTVPNISIIVMSYVVREGYCQGDYPISESKPSRARTTDCIGTSIIDIFCSRIPDRVRVTPATWRPTNTELKRPRRSRCPMTIWLRRLRLGIVGPTPPNRRSSSLSGGDSAVPRRAEIRRLFREPVMILHRL